MAFLWTKELETGNAQIDSEHKQLIEAINNLLTACSSGHGRDELANTVDFLSQYTKTHFGHEETLQRQTGYPDYANHKRYHESFIKIVNDFSVRLKSEGATIKLVGEINSQLGGWLLNHIKSEDVKVARHVAAQKK